MDAFLLDIVRREKEVFTLSIVALEELKAENPKQFDEKLPFDATLVKIYFEQCYPYIIMLKDELIELIGAKTYKHKIANMPEINE